VRSGYRRFVVDRLSAAVITSPGDEKGDHNHDHPHPPPEPGRLASRRNRPVPLVIGILLALVGFPLLLGGLGLAWAMATQRDDDGFFSTPTEQLTTETVALSSEVVTSARPATTTGGPTVTSPPCG
jgi:hypothetical protein